MDIATITSTTGNSIDKSQATHASTNSTSTSNAEIIPEIAIVDQDTTTDLLSDRPWPDQDSNVNDNNITDHPNLVRSPPSSTDVLPHEEEKGEEKDDEEMNSAANIAAVTSGETTRPTTSTGTTTTTSTSTSTSASTNTKEEETMMMTIMDGKNEFDPHAASALQTLFREHEAMKEKVTKLKTLLGRSAKAQRDTKVEMELWQRKYDTLYKENTKLQTRIQQMSARPTHLDLLADFETNFDRALLSVVQSNNNTQIQSGGQDTSGTICTTMNHTHNATTGPGSTMHATTNATTTITTTTLLDTAHNIHNHSNSMDHILMQELTDAKKRIETLEQYNATLVQRCTQLEHQNTNSKRNMTELQQKISHLELEKKMAQMEVDHMTKQLQYNQSSLEEMQLEIELLSKQSTIQQTAAHRREVLLENTSNSGRPNHHHKSDPQLIQHLQEQVKALEEWAVASNHAKAIANDRIRLLEEQLATRSHPHCGGAPTASLITDVSVRSNSARGGDNPNTLNHDDDGKNHHHYESSNPSMNPIHNNEIDINTSSTERVLDTRKASIVIGAGDVGVVVFELPTELLKSINHFTQRIVLRWRFDILQGAEADITFSIWKGSCRTASERRSPTDAIIPKRHVKGGAGGEIDENAFSVRQSCTVVWSNEHSWVRPRTVKYILEAIVMDD